MATEKEKQEQVIVPGYLKFSKVIVWLLYFWVMIGIIALALRVFLLAFSANPNTGFVEFVYRLSNDYLQPFRGIFPPREVGETGYLDVAAMFAIVVYLFVAWGFRALIDFVQNKIDKTKMEQEAEIRKAEREKQLAAQRKAAARQAAAKKAN